MPCPCAKLVPSFSRVAALQASFHDLRTSRSRKLALRETLSQLRRIIRLEEEKAGTCNRPFREEIGIRMFQSPERVPAESFGADVDALSDLVFFSDLPSLSDLPFFSDLPSPSDLPSLPPSGLVSTPTDLPE